MRKWIITVFSASKYIFYLSVFVGGKAGSSCDIMIVESEDVHYFQYGSTGAGKRRKVGYYFLFEITIR